MDLKDFRLVCTWCGEEPSTFGGGVLVQAGCVLVLAGTYRSSWRWERRVF